MGNDRLTATLSATGLRYDRRIVADEAAREDIPAVVLDAIAAVESGRRPVGSDGLLLARYEPHLYAGSATNWRQSLALPSRDRRQSFHSAAARDLDGALRAASLGSWQILGRWHDLLGYPSSSSMARAWASDFRLQARDAARWINLAGLGPAARALDIDALAVGYNGPGQPDVWARRLRKAIEVASGDRVQPVLSLGSRGPAVRRLQQVLGVPVDGAFGALTREAVRQFQAAHGLAVDGVVGARTWAALSDTRSPGVLAQIDQASRIGERVGDVARSVGAAGGSVLALVEVVPGPFRPWLVIGIFCLGGVVVASWAVSAILRGAR